MDTLKIKRMICFTLIMLFATLSIDFTVFAVEADEESSFNSIVEIESYSVDGDYIEAGKESNVNLTLHNANRTSEATNLIVSIRSNSGMIYPKYGEDNQLYVGNLKAGSSASISIPIVVASSFTGEYVDFICDIVYVIGNKKITNSAIMILPGQSIEAIDVESLEVSAHAIKNNQSLLSISYSNKGTDNINDAVLVIDGNVSESTNEIMLGSVAAGKSYNKDCNIIFTESGEQSVSVMIKYTDVDGELIKSNIGTFRVTVADENSSTIIDDTPDPNIVWTGRAISAIALLLIAIFTIRYIKKR